VADLQQCQLATCVRRHDARAAIQSKVEEPFDSRRGAVAALVHAVFCPLSVAGSKGGHSTPTSTKQRPHLQKQQQQQQQQQQQWRRAAIEATARTDLEGSDYFDTVDGRQLALVARSVH
jgi:hypothetical protein